MIALEAKEFKVAPPPEEFRDLGLRPDSAWSRLWQLAVALIGLLLLLPVSLAIAIATKLTSRGPVLYKGTRIGRNMEPFTIFKFRTLLVDAEQRIGARLLTPGDPLYTPVGRFLKRTKLDEIPQLLNVVRGDMNMVGPRPIRPVFLATSMREIRNYAARFVVRPGMTGLAQLRGGYFTHPRDKLRYDILYIRNRGFWLDLKLVVATFVKLLNRWLTLGLLLALIFLCASFVPGRVPLALRARRSAGSTSRRSRRSACCSRRSSLRPPDPRRTGSISIARPPTGRCSCFVVFSVLAGLVAGDLVPRLRDVGVLHGLGLPALLPGGERRRDAGLRAPGDPRGRAGGGGGGGGRHPPAGAGGACWRRRLAARTAACRGSRRRWAARSCWRRTWCSACRSSFVELVCAERREERDFWLICTTLVVVAVLLTQTRLSLLALWLTGAVFAWRVSRRAFRLVARRRRSRCSACS